LAATVIDFETPSAQRALKAFEDKQARTMLLKYAVVLTGSEDDGKDLLWETLYCLCDAEDGRPWAPDEGTFLTHARLVLRDLALRMQRSAHRRREVRPPDFAIEEAAVDEDDPPDEVLARKRELDRDRQRAQLLRERLDPLTLRVFEERRPGEDDCSVIALRCHCGVEAVYEANRRIAYHASQILADEARGQTKRVTGEAARRTIGSSGGLRPRRDEES
jgi:DNA-directed RNA polymerase specialized sigma24 family protein